MLSAHEQQVKEWFERDTTRHELTVLHDDGVYRHLRFAQPGTSCQLMDVTTWPYHLCVSGDMGTFVFLRIRDMLDFFEDGYNPYYWGEKLQAPRGRDGVSEWDPDAYRQIIDELLASHVGDELPDAEEWRGDWMSDEARDEVAQKALDLYEEAGRSLYVDEATGEPPHDRSDAIRLMYHFDAEGFSIDEPWDYTLTQFSAQYLWCCRGITEVVKRYRTAKKEEVAP